MKYHSLTIRPNNIYVQESIEYDTIIKSVSLTPSVSENSKRSSLIAEIDTHRVTLCNLLINRTESKILNIPIREGSRIELRTEGENDLDVLFLEIEPHEIEEEQDNSKYKVIKITENTPYTVRDKERIKILNISLSNEDISRVLNQNEIAEITEITVKNANETILRTKLEIGIKECEVVDIEIEQGIEIITVGPGTVELLVLEAITDKTDTLTQEIDQTAEISENKNKPAEISDNKRKSAEISEIANESVKKPRIHDTTEEITVETKATEETITPKDKATVETEQRDSTPKTTLNPKDPVITDDDWSQPAEDQIEIKKVSEGIGRLIGRRSVISVDYSINRAEITDSFTEKIIVRKLPAHIHLKYFSEIIKGAREGSVFKGVIVKPTSTTEILVKIGRIE